MNSEEIEVSLKAEFESYLKEVSEGFKDKLSQLQAKIDEEIDRHKAEFGRMLGDASEHFESGSALKPSFADIVVEHLKLARDEGSQISARAFAEAEQYEKENAPVVEAVPAVIAASGNMAGLRDAIKDVNEKPSQVEILKALIEHAAEFAPRGAFFVLKNERFGGWKTFGEDTDSDDAIKHVAFSVSAPSVINESVKHNEVKESSYGEFEEDSQFLDQVGFGKPEKMYAVPLVVRGRSVAVLYADQGEGEVPVNVAALETLVQVASMRVELLASLKGQPEAAEAAETADVHESPNAPVSHDVSEVKSPAYLDEAAPAYQPNYQPESYEAKTVGEYSDAAPVNADVPVSQPVESFYDEPANYSFEDEAASIEVVEEPAAEQNWQPVTEFETTHAFETTQPVVDEVEENVTSQPEAEFEFQSNYQPAPVPEPTPEFEVEPSYETAQAPSFEGFSPVKEAPSFAKDSGFESFKAEPKVEEAEFTTEVAAQPVSTPPVRSRLSERNVDLPIEVSDDERRLHNDARRFARLLVSEIKLYNEAKVKEGRDNGDIYNRLQEAVDRSREMYDKRVQPAVAGRFDYFHYELVNSLAEGEESKLGSGYPGAAV